MTSAGRPDSFDFNKYLDFLKSHNHNFIRLWAWDLLSWDIGGDLEDSVRILQVSPQPWVRTGPELALDGKPKFNLEQYNPEYFQRLKNRVIAARKAGIYVSIMLFEGWGLQFASGSFVNHPFHPMNNINGIEFKEGQDSLVIYELVNDKIISIQEGYIRKVIETVGNEANVLYEISNENHPISTEWQYHMIRYIKDLEKKRGKSHPVGMTFQYKGGNNKVLFDSPADWISPNQEGGYKDDPPISEGTKVILSDTDHLWGIGGNRQWVWKSFLRGLNPILMDFYEIKEMRRGLTELGAEEIRLAMAYTMMFSDKMELINMVPSKTIASSEYCLANEGKDYLVYIPEGKSTEINLGSVKGVFNVEWFDPLSGNFQKALPVKGGGKITMISPFEQDEAVVYLKLKNIKTKFR